MPRTAIPVLLLVTLAACQSGGDVTTDADGALVRGRTEATAVETRSVRLDGRTLVLDGFAGDVTLTADPAATEVSAQFTRRARGATDASAQERLREVTLNEAGDGELFQYVWRTQLHDGTSVDADVTLPPGATVVLRLGAGALQATGLAGSLDAEVGAGTAMLDAVRPATLRLDVGSGTVTVDAAGVPAGAEWTLQTGAGTVTLGLPADASVRVDARTASGAVNARGLTFADERLSGGPADRRFRGTLGDGSATVEVSTGAGAITLRRTGGE